jgi:hypothetical protein
MAVRWDLTRIDDGWIARDPAGNVKAYGATQKRALENVADAANESGDDITVRIHAEDGRVEELEYPRPAD